MIKTKKGFTLIEVLVVIGIIAVLAAVVLVAVNPTRQFKLARDSQRTSNVNTLLNAIHQNIAEHKGTFMCGGTARTLPVSVTAISHGGGYPSHSGDIASCLISDYISAMPFDPSAASGHYTSPTDYDTAYEVVQDADGRITVSSSGELTPTISVTR